MKLPNIDLKEKLANLKSGNVSCVDNVQYFLSEIKKSDKKYNIVLQIKENIEEIAKNLDKKKTNKANLGPLFGLVFLIKSNISIKNLNISCASKTLENYKGTFDADVVRKIEESDGIILGTLNCDEFASGSSGENSAFGPTINPKVQSRVPGGSSSGAAAAVAADFCDIALGSDTGGSIRNPASNCGVIGIKPSYGRVSRYGLVDLSMSLDQIGPLSADLYGSQLTMSVISGQSDNDPTTHDVEVPNFVEENSVESMKVGVIKEFEDLVEDKRILDLFKEKVEKFKELGHEIVELEVKNIDLAIQAYYPIVYTEFFSGTRKLDGIKYGEKIDEVAGPEALRRVFGGREISRSEFDGAYYKKALKVKEIISEEFTKAFSKVDIILAPVIPSLPHKLGTKLSLEEMYAIDAFTIPANLAGLCGGVVSKDTIKEDNEEVFVGFQILANRFEEKKMFKGLKVLETI